MTDGPDYTSHNTGTISADSTSLQGNFNDGSTSENYTATKDGSGASPTPSASASSSGAATSSVQLVCNTPASPAQQGSCTATVGGTGGTAGHPVPTGTVTMTTSTGTLYGSTCTLAAQAGAATAPSCTLAYQPPAGGLPAGTPVPVSATYNGDGVFPPASAGTQLYGYSDDPDSDQGLGLCLDGSGSCDGYDESLSTLIVDDISALDLTSSCSGSAQGANLAGDENPLLTQCLVNYQAALTAGSAVTTLESQKAARSIITGLATFATVEANQHTGGSTGALASSAARKADQACLGALKALDDGNVTQASTDAAAAIGDLVNTGAQSVLDNSLGGDLPPSGDSGKLVAAAAAPAAAPLNVKAALAYVLGAHPTAGQAKAFQAAVTAAYAKKHSAARTRARAVLVFARALGALELDRELAKKGKLPKTVTLTSAAKTLAPGTVTSVQLPLSVTSQRILKVVSLLKSRPAVTLTLVQKRDGHTRRATVKLQVQAA